MDMGAMTCAMHGIRAGGVLEPGGDSPGRQNETAWETHSHSLYAIILANDKANDDEEP